MTKWCEKFVAGHRDMLLEEMSSDKGLDSLDRAVCTERTHYCGFLRGMAGDEL